MSVTRSAPRPIETSAQVIQGGRLKGLALAAPSELLTLHHTDGLHPRDLARDADGRHDIDDHRDVFVRERGLLREDALALPPRVDALGSEVADDPRPGELARGGGARADAAGAVARGAKRLLH